MKKIVVFIIVVILIIGICVGIAYGINAKNKNVLTPTFNFMLEEEQSKIWVGTFQLAWNSMLDYLEVEKAEVEGGNTPLIDELNKKIFTREQLSEEDYYIAVGEPTFQFGNETKEEIEEKFGIETDILDNIMPKSENENPTGFQMIIYALLNKEFNFLNEFDRLENGKFKESEELVKYFGIDSYTDEQANDNVTVLFYNSEEEFAVKLNTKENEEVYLYRTNEEKAFDDIYKDMLNKYKKYKGNEKFTERDLLEIPYISLNESISYDELINKDIVNANERFKISSALQDIEFTLNNKGGKVISEAEITIVQSLQELNAEEPRKFIFNDNFYMFLKEKDKELPYMALKIDNTDFLVNEDSDIQSN